MSVEQAFREWADHFGPPYPKIHYSPCERLHFRILGRWPERVVERRLAAHDQYTEEFKKWWPR